MMSKSLKNVILFRMEGVPIFMTLSFFSEIGFV